MRYIFLITLLLTTLFGAEVVKIDKKYQKSKNCMPCHARIVKEWRGSWHAKSHFKSDEYFAKSLKYYSRKTRKSLNATKVACAKCHNPRISVTKTDQDYEIAAVMGLDKDSNVAKAVESDAISEGINCVVCHNIDKIHYNYPKDKRGIDRVEWTPSGVMTGPYSDAHSPYHKIVSHDFMNEKVNELCFVCHANDRSASGVVFTDMEAQYKASKSKEKCVSCHMGQKYKDVAATFKNYKGHARMREVRSHVFAGGHKEKMLKNALDLTLKKRADMLFITLKNPLPHNMPSGFGARELLVVATYYKGESVIEKKEISLTQHYTRKRGRVATPHLARKATADVSVPAKGKKVLKTKIPQGSERVVVEVYYRLVNDEVRKLLKLKEKLWSKKFAVTAKELQLH